MTAPRPVFRLESPSSADFLPSPGPGASSLGKRGITRQQRDPVATQLVNGLESDEKTLSAEEDAWLWAVETITLPHRQALWAHHQAIVDSELLNKTNLERALHQALEEAREDEGERLAIVLHDAEKETKRVVERIRWHKGRASGQTLRFRKVRSCGKGKVWIKRPCGHVEERDLHCDVSRACVACRSRAAFKRRARFARGRFAALTHARRAGLLHRRRPGGAWGEKHLTLTMPHTLETKEAVLAIFAAWTFFARSLQGYFRSNREAFHGEKADYYRAFEWTPGDDGRGHAHFHIWLLAPYLEQSMLREWWRSALKKANVPIPTYDDDHEKAGEEKPVNVHITSVENPKGKYSRDEHFERELLKSDRALQEFAKMTVREHGGVRIVRYADGWSIMETFVDREGRKQKIEPALAAALYEALESKRMAQSSRRFYAADTIAKGCRECGDPGPIVVQVREASVIGRSELDDFHRCLHEHDLRRMAAPPVEAPTSLAGAGPDVHLTLAQVFALR